MLMAFIIVLVIIVLVGGGLLVLHQTGALKTNGAAKTHTTDAELDEDVPVEDLHSIVAHRYVPYSHDETRILAQVECICGWSDALATTTYAKSRGEQHVNNQRDRITQKRETARKVAEKLAENEKGDFAW